MLVGDQTICGTPIANLSPGSEKRVQVKCDRCGQISIAIWHNYTESQKRRGNPGTTYCKPCAGKRISKLNVGKPSPHKGKSFPERQGANSPSWRGGTYIASDGYRMVHRSNPYAVSKWENYVKEHVAVIEEHRGYKMLAGEVIHHINGDKLDNRLENLVVFTSDQLHRQAHIQLERLAMELVQKGLIRFDQETMSYVADLKLRELLETPEEDNQQPSPEGDLGEGSTTSENGLPETMSHHERGAPFKIRCHSCGGDHPTSARHGIDIRKLINGDDIV